MMIARAVSRVLVMIAASLIGLIGGIVGGAVLSLAAAALYGGILSGDYSILVLGIPLGAFSGLLAGLCTGLLGIRTRLAWDWALIPSVAVLAVFGPIHSWNLFAFAPVLLIPVGAGWLAAMATRWLLTKRLPKGSIQAWMLLVFALAVILLVVGARLITQLVVSLY
jgi:hypothetical protein